MKKLLLAVVVLALVFSVNNLSMASGKLSLSVGADVLLPTGTFGDAQSTGFGGSLRGQYDVTPMASVGLTVGYYTWSGKDFTSEGVTVSGTKFSGLPIRVFGKYFFMPEGEKLRVYGIVELGLFFSSYDVPTFNFLTGQVTTTSQTSSDFNYAPGVGLELPLGSGSTKLDVSVRYDGIARSGTSAGNIGARVGVNFPLGN